MQNQVSETVVNTISSVTADTNPLITKSEDAVMEVVKSLNSLSLITQAEVSTLEKAQSFLLSTYTDVPAHRTYIDKSVGVLTNGRFPTADAKYWQCKKEAEVQFYELMREFMNHRKAMISTKEMIYKREKTKEALVKGEGDAFLIQCDIDRFDVAIMELNIGVKKIEKEIKYRIAEIGDWLAISKEWEDKMKHSETIYGEHQVESLFMWIESQAAEARRNNDKDSERNFTDQMNTMKSLLERKLKQFVK